VRTSSHQNPRPAHHAILCSQPVTSQEASHHSGFREPATPLQEIACAEFKMLGVSIHLAAGTLAE
jgi:hypothetical protein